MSKDWTNRFGRGPWLAAGAAGLLAVGAGGGAGAVALTRPPVELPPANPTPIARLATARGIVTVQGRVENVFGDRVLVRDGSGQTLVDVGPRAGTRLTAGTPLKAQGRFADGQLHARYLIGADGVVEEVAPPPPPHGPGGPGGPPPPPAKLAAGDVPPPPPAQCGDGRGPGAGAPVPPPPPAGRG